MATLRYAALLSAVSGNSCLLVQIANYSLQDNGDSSTNARKTPLSLVYSGVYSWVDGRLHARGSNGYFWSSTPSSTVRAHYLVFYSTRLIPQHGGNKIYGFTIRCVGRQIVYKTMTLLLLLMLRKLLFPLSTPETTAGSMAISAVVAQAATSGHLLRTSQQTLTSYTSPLLVWYLRLATVRYTAFLSAVSSRSRSRSILLAERQVHR